MSDVSCTRKDCFAYCAETRCCHALADTDFGGKPCPFYKTKKQNDRDTARAQTAWLAKTGQNQYTPPGGVA